MARGYIYVVCLDAQSITSLKLGSKVIIGGHHQYNSSQWHYIPLDSIHQIILSYFVQYHGFPNSHEDKSLTQVAHGHRVCDTCDGPLVHHWHSSHNHCIIFSVQAVFYCISYTCHPCSCHLSQQCLFQM